jgi:uncharacterized lipoprotein YmbA
MSALGRLISRPMLLILIFAVLAPACVKLGKSSPSSFYVLSSAADTSEFSSASSLPSRPVVGIRPVVLPQVLERPHLVIQRSQNEVEIVQSQRWGEPLEDGIERVLVENLVSMIPTRSVFTIPTQVRRDFDFWLGLEIFQYGYTGEGTVILLGRWTINRGAEGEILAQRTSEIQEDLAPTEGADEIDYTQVAAAMSRALRRLAREIATEIQEQTLSGGSS